MEIKEKYLTRPGNKFAIKNWPMHFRKAGERETKEDSRDGFRKRPVKMADRIMVVMAVILLGASTGSAQGSNRYLTWGQNIVAIDNLVIMDSIQTGSRVAAYTAAFDIIPNGTVESKQVLSELVTASRMGNTIPAMTLCRVNNRLDLVEERTWNNVAIPEVVLPEMNGMSGSLTKIRFAITAASATVKNDEKSRLSLPKIEAQRVGVTSNFRFRVGTLPEGRVAKVSSLNMKGNSGQPLSFFIELSAEDAKEWAGWLMNSAGGLKKEPGMLELLGRDMRPLLQIDLGGLEIFSYATSYSSNQQFAQRVTIGLRAPALLIHTDK